jgi:hypothetical protein
MNGLCEVPRYRMRSGGGGSDRAAHRRGLLGLRRGRGEHDDRRHRGSKCSLSDELHLVHVITSKFWKYPFKAAVVPVGAVVVAGALAPTSVLKENGLLAMHTT